ncbi:hypothetical protein DFA_02682 [Cavenderia fasciculata]|uniref:Uncharacterized protein n=1 Tax=Cavenderia fasciculata TaxID=261658 RepID=F4Q028_CACFS|nr:uncharacterized protein DFA_02682 [Cavenderia fasciculata]EGG18942.1 hypothetical protein DFA_02682 [Cavenderia fasciculata]|eukprot:XP_004357404.1 hypothetical protein DFA_02682 [Cavenderia fasciculata]
MERQQQIQLEEEIKQKQLANEQLQQSLQNFEQLQQQQQQLQQQQQQQQQPPPQQKENKKEKWYKKLKF